MTTTNRTRPWAERRAVRRSLLQAGAAVAMPGVAWGAVFHCEPALHIAVLAPITGPLAGPTMHYVEGARQAAETSAGRGCAVTLSVLDAPGPVQLLSATLQAARQRGAAVVMAPYGVLVATLAAERAPEVLVIDLLQSSPLKPHPPNLVAVPYADLFYTSAPERRTESLRAVARAAVSIVLETVRDSTPGSIQTPADFIAAMGRRRYEIPGGTVTLDRASGAFRRV